MDLSMLVNQTWINLRTKKFYCHNKECRRKIFTERYSDHFKLHQRITERLANRLLDIAHQSGGNGGKRLCRIMHTPVSGRTLIRTIHRQPLAAFVTPRVLGIDDWAYTKGLTMERYQLTWSKEGSLTYCPTGELKQ